MALDFEDQNESEEALAKWPFFLSAFFILGITLLFAYLHHLQEGMLGTWQLICCIFASAVASILIFLPLFVEKALFLSFSGKKPQEEELHRKIFFDMKEVKERLDSLEVKIDKVPSVVDQILKNSKMGDNGNTDSVSSLLDSFYEMESNLTQKISALESVINSPLLPESDPQFEEIQKNLVFTQERLDYLSANFEKLQYSINEIKTELETSTFSPPFLTSANLENPEKIQGHAKTPSLSEVIEEEVTEEKEDEVAQEESLEESFSRETQEIEASSEEDQTDENDPFDEENLEESFFPEFQGEDPSDQQVTTDEDEALDEKTLEESFIPESQQEDHSDQEVATDKHELPDEEDLEEADADGDVELTKELSKNVRTELDLDLPDPQETIRKVDALLAGEKIFEDPTSKIEKEAKSKNNDLTSVIANVMIGIGNKPYLRGEGPGLSWDIGVPMNFIEIGKWAWSPSRKNASLTIQVYRNDEDPDTSGKFEVKPGEKFEFTPKF